MQTKEPKMGEPWEQGYLYVDYIVENIVVCVQKDVVMLWWYGVYF